MGFCTTINYQTGREVLICDFCGQYPARKIRCPYGWCQPWAACAKCRSAGWCRINSCGVYDTKGYALPHRVLCKARVLSQRQRLDKYGKRYEWELTPEQAAESAVVEYMLIVEFAKKLGLEYKPASVKPKIESKVDK